MDELTRFFLCIGITINLISGAEVATTLGAWLAREITLAKRKPHGRHH